jgi:starch-binding outer membrane protein, SusD/RagB family
MGGTLTDEFKNADFQTVRIAIDLRTQDNSQDWNYSGLSRARGSIRDAIFALQKYVPDSLSLIGELYAELGYMEMTLADNYCNGIPLGHTIAGVQTQGAPLTTQQVYDSAITHADSGIKMITGTDAYSVYARREAQIVEARALLMKGQFAQAAALVSVANVPTSYQYDMTFSASGGTNGMWSLANSTARISVADSFDFVGGAVNVIKNALPFASAGDPRLPVLSGKAPNPVIAAEDGATPMFISQLWKGQFDPMVLASGVDARLIEAEAALNANGGTAADIANMMTILNNLRAAKPSLGNYAVPAMAALPTPATKAAAVALFFREKAFWTFGRGQRLPDMRRMLRLYAAQYPDESTVFPKGVYFKGGVYGTDVNIPVPSIEQANPLFSGCLDRLP